MSVLRMLKKGLLSCAVDPPCSALCNRMVLPTSGCWVLVPCLFCQKSFLNAPWHLSEPLTRNSSDSMPTLCVIPQALLSCRALKIWPFPSQRGFFSPFAEGAIRAGQGAEWADDTTLPWCFLRCEQLVLRAGVKNRVKTCFLLPSLSI